MTRGSIRGGHGAVAEEGLTGKAAVRFAQQERGKAADLVHGLVAALREVRAVALRILFFRDPHLLRTHGVQVLDAVGVDAAGADGVDQDVVLAELAGQGLGKTHHAHAEGVGDDEVVERLLDGGRGAVQDAALSGFAHVRQDGADGDDIAVQALLVAVGPVGFVHGVETAGLRAGAKVHKAVNTAQLSNACKYINFPLRIDS